MPLLLKKINRWVKFIKVKNELKESLDEKVALYNQVSFIKDDPVSIPHLFSKKQDIEIAGFFADGTPVERALASNRGMSSSARKVVALEG